MKQHIMKRLKELYNTEKPHRLQHVLGVRDTAIQLGNIHHCNLEKLEIAAMLHDVTKYYSAEKNIDIIKGYYKNSKEILKEYNEKILHAFSAAAVADKEFGISDKDILNAIRHHTIGKAAMNIFEEIIFISDYIEPNRTYDSCKKVRKIAFSSLKKAIYEAMNDSIMFHESHHNKVPQTAYLARDYYRQILEDYE